MIDSPTWTRRGLTGLVGAAALSACATPARRGLVTVNLMDADTPPRLPTAGDGIAELETALDAALRMTVPVELDGRGPFNFVVDTGANRSVVSRELAAAIGLPSAGKAAVHGIAGAQLTDLAAVRRLKVGEVSSSKLTMPVLPRTLLGADGLLGVDMLKDRHVTLDFRRRRFEIHDSREGAVIRRGNDTRISAPDAPVRVGARYRFGQLVILDAMVNETPVSAFIDSGSQVTVGNRALRDAVVRRTLEAPVRLAPVPLLSVTGQTMTGEFGVLRNLRLGGLNVRDVMGIFADLHIFDLWKLNDRPAILIGVDVLRHFPAVELDYGRREVIFTPPRRSGQP